MIKIKNILSKWFSKKPKLLGYENCELKVIKEYGDTIRILVPKGYNNPKIGFLKEWVENENAKYEFGLHIYDSKTTGWDRLCDIKPEQLITLDELRMM